MNAELATVMVATSLAAAVFVAFAAMVAYGAAVVP